MNHPPPPTWRKEKPEKENPNVPIENRGMSSMKTNRMKEEWYNEDDINNRMDIIGQNGNDGQHYEKETLEEVAERKYGNCIYSFDQVDAFVEGAKWQQERSYSEEDMKSAFKVGFSIGYGSDVQAIDEKNRTCDEWFEQFKKK